MKAEELIARRIAEMVRLLAGGADSLVVGFGPVFWQAASFPGEGVLVEVAGNSVLPEEHRLDEAGRARMLELGFTAPDADMPNWWIGIEGDDRDAFLAAGTAVVTTLLELFGVSAVELARKSGLSVEWFDPSRLVARAPAVSDGPVERIEVETLRGLVVLSSDRTATLDGTPWSSNPVKSWATNRDGRVVVTFEKPDDDWFPWVAFLADSAETNRLLSAFRPSDEQIVRLQQRLAILEHRWLEP